MRKLAMRRAARKHKVFIDSSHGVKRHPTASISRYSKGKKAFVFQSTPPSSSTGVPYKTKIQAPLELSLTILPATEETVTVNTTADTESERVSKEDDTAQDDEGKSSSNNEDHSLPHGKPRVTGHEGSTTRHGGTSSIPRHNMAVRPGMQTSSGVRWKVAYHHAKLDDSNKGKRYKKKRKKSHSRTEDPTEEPFEEPVDSSSPGIVAMVTGIVAGILVFLSLIVFGIVRLW